MPSSQAQAHEHSVTTLSGWVALPLVLLLLLLGVAACVGGELDDSPGLFGIGVVLIVLFFMSFAGFFTLEPNEARVLVLFGDYKGTVRKDGFHFGNPFYSNGKSMHVTGKEIGRAHV